MKQKWNTRTLTSDTMYEFNDIYMYIQYFQLILNIHLTHTRNPQNNNEEWVQIFLGLPDIFLWFCHLYFSHSANCISLSLSHVFLWVCHLYFSNSVTCIYLILSPVFLSNCQLYFLCVNCISLRTCRGWKGEGEGMRESSGSERENSAEDWNSQIIHCN